jgi:hypothetical protein
MPTRKDGRLYLTEAYASSGYNIINSFSGVSLPEIPGWTWIMYCGEPRIQNDADSQLFAYITDMRRENEGQIELDFFYDGIKANTDPLECDSIEEAINHLTVWAQLGGY